MLVIWDVSASRGSNPSRLLFLSPFQGLLTAVPDPGLRPGLHSDAASRLALLPFFTLGLHPGCTLAPLRVVALLLGRMPGPLRVLLRSDDLTVTHMNDAVAIGGRFRIVGDHEHGLA